MVTVCTTHAAFHELFGTEPRFESPHAPGDAPALGTVSGWRSPLLRWMAQPQAMATARSRRRMARKSEARSPRSSDSRSSWPNSTTAQAATPLGRAWPPGPTPSTKPLSRPGPTETGGSSRMLAAKDAGEPCREAGARFEPGGGEETRPAGPTQPHGPDASHRPDTLTARFRSGPRPPLPEGSEPVPCRLPHARKGRTSRAPCPPTCATASADISGRLRTRHVGASPSSLASVSRAQLGRLPSREGRRERLAT